MNPLNNKVMIGETDCSVISSNYTNIECIPGNFYWIYNICLNKLLKLVLFKL